MALDYKKKRPRIKKVQGLPKNGLWVPISIASQMSKYSDQMIRHLHNNGIIAGIRFERGPMLINYKDLEEKWFRPEGYEIVVEDSGGE